MKGSLLILITFLFTSCMDITIPDFKSDKQPEDEKGEEAGSNTDNGSSDEEEEDEPSETIMDNTYPLITSATIHSEALPYVSLFIFYGNIFGQNLDYSNLIVSFENNVNGAYVGQCSSINGNQNKLIKINNDIWQGLNNTYREQLIFHEAAHCVLGRPHKGNNFLNPESILNPSLFPDYVYVQRYNEFIYELFESPITEHDFVFGEMRSRE